MQLIAFCPEYQITVEPDRNRIFYKHYAELAQAQELPNYLNDWRLALAIMQPGFTILSDMTDLPTVSDHLAELIGLAQQLVLGMGVRQVATVHAPSSETYYISETVRAESALPVRTFTDLWEADKFLDKLISDPAI